MNTNEIPEKVIAAIERAETRLYRDMYESSQSEALIAIAYSLAAIANELRVMNERAELEEERRELLEVTEPDYPDLDNGSYSDVAREQIELEQEAREAAMRMRNICPDCGKPFREGNHDDCVPF